MIKFKNVSKNYGEKQVLNNINLEINKGDIYGVIGYSGAGKSTLVRLINGLEDITSGTVEVLNQDLNNLNKKDQAKLRQKIGFIFQNFNLLSQKTVYENIYVILQIAGYVKREIDDRIIEVLDIVGLADKHDAYPSELSGGQKQRVGIARAIANNPDILLCDEATSALDPETTKSILQILKNINIKYKLTIVLITHEMEVIANICNKVAVIDDGEIVESGDTYSCFVNPQHNTTKLFVNSVISLSVPDSIISHYQNTENSYIKRLIFNNNNVEQPVLNELAIDFKCEFNILYGSIFEFQDNIVGNLIVKFNLDATEYVRLENVLKEKNILLKELSL